VTSTLFLRLQAAFKILWNCIDHKLQSLSKTERSKYSICERKHTLWRTFKHIILVLIIWSPYWSPLSTWYSYDICTCYCWHIELSIKISRLTVLLLKSSCKIGGALGVLFSINVQICWRQLSTVSNESSWNISIITWLPVFAEILRKNTPDSVCRLAYLQYWSFLNWRNLRFRCGCSKLTFCLYFIIFCDV